MKAGIEALGSGELEKIRRDRGWRSVGWNITYLVLLSTSLKTQPVSYLAYTKDIYVLQAQLI